MSEQLRLRGDVLAVVAAYTGPSREVVIDTTNNRVVVQDGVTPGGWAAAKLSEVSKVTRTPIAASYSAVAGDRLIAVTSIVSPIYVTLPAAAAFQGGARLLIVDESGGASFAKPVVAVPLGSDVIAGLFSATIASGYGFLEFESNGVGQWTMSDGVPPGASAPSSPTAAAASLGASAFSGQAVFGVAQPMFSLTVSEPRLRAGMRPVVQAVNPAAAAKGQLALLNVSSFGPGQFTVFGALLSADGKSPAAPASRTLLTIAYIGA